MRVNIPLKVEEPHCHTPIAILPRMAVPKVIPIGYEPDYHTGAIGHWEGGQFLGSVVAAFPESYTITDD
jgi:hypothetical protein